MGDDERDLEAEESFRNMSDMADVNTRRKKSYIPTKPNHTERMREERVKELAMYAIIQEVILYIVFMCVLLVVSYGNQDANAYIMKEQYMNTLLSVNGSLLFDKSITIEEYWSWVQTCLEPNLYAGRWYNGDDPEQQEHFFGDRYGFIIGYPVMRQVRVRPDLCNVHDDFKSYINECNVGYSMSNEDEGSYEAGWIPTNLTEGLLRDEYTYTSWDELDGYPFLGRHAVYMGGGYVVKLTDPDMLEDKMLQLYEEAWIDRYTRAVFVEFCTYNAQVNLFAVVNIVVEFLPSGGGFFNPNIDTIRLLSDYEGFALFQVCCEIVFFVFIIFFTVKEIRVILKEKRQYLKVFWNLVEFTIIAFSICLIVVYFYRFYTTKCLARDLKKNGGRGYVKLQYVAYWNELLGYMIGWVVFMSTVKFIKLLRFNRRIGVLSSTILLAAGDLIWFGMFFAIVFLGYSVAFYLILGSEVFDYSDFVYTMESLVTAILGVFGFHEIRDADRVLAPIFFFFFVFSITFILINMFVAILEKSYQAIQHDADKQQSNDYEMVDFMMSRFKAVIGKPLGTILNSKHTQDEASKNTEEDDMDVLADKVDTLLNHIAQVYLNEDDFDDIIESLLGRWKGRTKPDQNNNIIYSSET